MHPALGRRHPELCRASQGGQARPKLGINVGRNRRRLIEVAPKPPSSIEGRRHRPRLGQVRPQLLPNSAESALESATFARGVSVTPPPTTERPRRGTFCFVVPQPSGAQAVTDDVLVWEVGFSYLTVGHFPWRSLHDALPNHTPSLGGLPFFQKINAPSTPAMPIPCKPVWPLRALTAATTAMC